jgi:hypothetical protein
MGKNVVIELQNEDLKIAILNYLKRTHNTNLSLEDIKKITLQKRPKSNQNIDSLTIHISDPEIPPSIIRHLL